MGIKPKIMAIITPTTLVFFGIFVNKYVKYSKIDSRYKVKNIWLLLNKENFFQN